MIYCAASDYKRLEAVWLTNHIFGIKSSFFIFKGKTEKITDVHKERARLTVH